MANFSTNDETSSRPHLIRVASDEIGMQCTYRDTKLWRCEEDEAARVLTDSGRWKRLCAEHAIHELGGHTDEDLQWEAEEQGWLDSLS